MNLREDFPGNDDFAKGIRGAMGEAMFDDCWLCHCGGALKKNDIWVPWEKDRRCLACGQLVDVKTSSSGDAISISMVPFDNYPPGMIVALYDSGIWLGVYRENCIIKSGPHPPAQHGKRPTWYYWIWKSNWEPLEFFLRRRP